MDEFGRALGLAVAMILRGDADLVAIVGLSLRVSLTAAALGFVLGAPLGALLATTRFPGRGAVLVLVNALLGLPPVVVGLVLYLLVSRSGPLGSLGLLFTPVFYIAVRGVSERFRKPKAAAVQSHPAEESH